MRQISAQVAGTNGKGSVARYLAAALSVLDRCGLFVSPHIFHPRERIRILRHGQVSYPLPDVQMHDYTQIFDDALPVLSPLPYAVYETGLGGRLDPVSRLDHRLIVITRIDLDHTGILGDTVTAIAAEKAAAIRPGQTVVTCAQHPDVHEIIYAACVHKDARLIVADDITVVSASPFGQTFDLELNGKQRRLTIKNMATVAPVNAAMAYAAALELGVPAPAAADAIASVTLPLRCCYDGKDVYDVCHNPASVRALADTLAARFDRKFTLISAVMADKDGDAMAREFARVCDRALTLSVHPPRGLCAEEWARLLRANGVDARPMEEGELPLDQPCVFAGTFYLFDALGFGNKFKL